MITLVSFDIDGTLECGEPPGVVTVELVRTAKRRGWLVGSCSDRPISYQEALWERLASGAGFRFLRADAAAHRAWVTELFASAPE